MPRYRNLFGRYVPCGINEFFNSRLHLIPMLRIRCRDPEIGGCLHNFSFHFLGMRLRSPFSPWAYSAFDYSRTVPAQHYLRKLATVSKEGIHKLRIKDEGWGNVYDKTDPLNEIDSNLRSKYVFIAALRHPQGPAQ